MASNNAPANTNDRGSFGSNIGFLLSAIGSAVGLGNIWGFPYKMGKSGGFTFLLIYILLAIFVGFVIMLGELSLGRKTGFGPVNAYAAVSKKFKWAGWLGVIVPFLVMTFYSVLGGYCIYYIIVNVIGLFKGTPGNEVFGALLTTPGFGIGVTLLFMLICFFINRSGVGGGIEKFNEVGMPALFVLLVIVIIKSLTMKYSGVGLKFMFSPGFSTKEVIIDGVNFGRFVDPENAPGVLTILATAAGQMFFSLSLAMGAMITYGSYLSKQESLPKNSALITVADTMVAIMAGIAVIPAAVADGMQKIAAGATVVDAATGAERAMVLSDIKLSGPGLLFSTLQNVFHNMGLLGSIIGIIFFVLVLIAAVSSAISLVEAVSVTFIDRASARGHEISRPRTVAIVCGVIMIFAVFVAADGLGERPFAPWQMFDFKLGTWNDCWLDFMDVWSEGIAMPLGALIMALMIGWELKPKFFADEIKSGSDGKVIGFWGFCMKFIVPIVMVFVLLVQISSFFDLGWF